jgi:predicted Zn-dependent protease
VTLELAQMELGAGHYAEALALLTPLAANEYRFADLQFSYASALRGNNRQEEAQARFAIAAEIRQQLRRASELTDQTADRPDDPALRYEIGRIYLENGYEKDGLMWLASALECEPQHGPTQSTLANYYARSGARPAARSLAENSRASESLRRPASGPEPIP